LDQRGRPGRGRAPWAGPAGRGLPPEPLPLGVIRVWDEAVEGVLVSTLPVADQASAAERIDG
jgi:hypothetical protein